VLIGGLFTVRLPDRVLRFALASTLFLAGLKLVDPPGADVVVLTGAVVAVGLIGVGLVRWALGRPAVGSSEA
jgi:hypothetical protein